MAVPLRITLLTIPHFFNDLDKRGMEKINSASSCQKTASQEGWAKSRRMRISNQTGISVNQRRNNILLSKLFYCEEKIVLVTEKNFWNLSLKAAEKICKKFVITWTIYSNSETSEQFLVRECLFNFFLKI